MTTTKDEYLEIKTRQKENRLDKYVKYVLHINILLSFTTPYNNRKSFNKSTNMNGRCSQPIVKF